MTRIWSNRREREGQNGERTSDNELTAGEQRKGKDRETEGGRPRSEGAINNAPTLSRDGIQSILLGAATSLCLEWLIHNLIKSMWRLNALSCEL